MRKPGTKRCRIAKSRLQPWAVTLKKKSRSSCPPLPPACLRGSGRGGFIPTRFLLGSNRMSERKTIRSEYVYRGRVVTLRVDTVQREDGAETIREIVEHHGAV